MVLSEGGKPSRAGGNMLLRVDWVVSASLYSSFAVDVQLSSDRLKNSRQKLEDGRIQTAARSVSHSPSINQLCPFTSDWFYN